MRYTRLSRFCPSISEDQLGLMHSDAPVAENMCAVVSNRWVNDDYKHLVVEAGSPALDAQPGQFFHLRCPSLGADRPFLRRPMSVYRIDRAAKRIEFLYKVTGAGPRGLASLEPGDLLDAF